MSARFASKCFALLALAIPAAVFAQPQPSPSPSPSPLGIFDDHGDIGTVLHPGTAAFDGRAGAYTLSGSGENMWFGVDDFHFVWKKVSGDVALSADIAFVGEKGNNHRKAVLMIRQSLDGHSAAVDIARHGDGLTSLQFREAAGADTQEVESSISSPRRMRLEKHGDTFIAYVSGKDGTLQSAGAATALKMTGDFYVGIGVSAHDKDATETAIFSKVKLETLTPAMDNKTTLHSSLETISIASTDRRVVYTATAHFEAPNWSRDGAYLLFNQDGLLYRLDFGTDMPVHIDTGFAVKCNNDHGISPDGKTIVVSDQSQNGHSILYTLPVGGGTPTEITKNSPSYWHGWSPDGKTLAFTGQRGDNFDIYSIPAAGGEETRLTSAPGLDDGPEYSPDGGWIYFNSERTGRMQIWRMKPDGSQQEQVLFSERNDWFPHISPDGKWMVFVSYDKSVKGHPANKDVELHLMSVADGKVRVLTKLFGGQGTINVHSWSPDSAKIAFVSYELLTEPAQD